MSQTILLICLVLILSLSGQSLMKKGVTQIGVITLASLRQEFFPLLWRIISNRYVLSGVFLAGIGAFLWLIVLSQANLSYALPILGALAYIVLPIISWLFLGEKVSLLRWFGTGIICVGIIIVARS